MPTQLDMFAAFQPAPPAPDDAQIQDARVRLNALVAKVEGVADLPWPRIIELVWADQEFLRLKALLAADEAAALWARWDPKLTRWWDEFNAPGQTAPA